MKYAILPFALTVLCGTTMPVSATDQKLRGETFCFPAKDVPKLVSELAKVKAKRRNIVDVRLQPRFVLKDDGVWPDRFYLAKGGKVVADLPFSRETGAVPTFISAVTERPDTDICVDDPTRADRPDDDEGLYFEMGLSPLFKSTTGQHYLDELVEAAEDGKKFYKKMLPDALSIFMPDTDYFAIRMIDPKLVPQVTAVKGKMKMSLGVEVFKDMWVVSLEEIKGVGADGIIIGGGAYDLQPVPSPKIMRKFGIGEAANAK